MRTLKEVKTLLGEATIDFNTIHKVDNPLDYVNLPSKLRQKLIGSGVQTIAFRTAPGVITKIVQLLGKNDIVVKLHQLYAENKSNFLFPRIFSAKMYQASFDSYSPPENRPIAHPNTPNRPDAFEPIDTHFKNMKVPIWMMIQMEALHSLSALPDHTGEADFLGRTVIQADQNFILQMLYNSGIEVDTKNGWKSGIGGVVLLNDISDALMYFIEYGTTIYNSKKSRFVYVMKENYLSKYVSAISKIKSVDSRWDIHASNYRVRLSKYGPQLVIIDPIVQVI